MNYYKASLIGFLCFSSYQMAYCSEPLLSQIQEEQEKNQQGAQEVTHRLGLRTSAGVRTGPVDHHLYEMWDMLKRDAFQRLPTRSGKQAEIANQQEPGQEKEPLSSQAELQREQLQERNGLEGKGGAPGKAVGYKVDL